MNHCRGDGMVEGHHRIVGHTEQQGVERLDLRPVGRLRARRLVVQGRDRRLKLVRPRPAARQGGRDQRHALGDRLAVPRGPVLLVERDELAPRSGARRAPRVGQQHQRQQARHLRLPGEAVVQGAGQAKSFAGEVGPHELGPGGGGIPLAEHQIEHLQHGIEACAELLAARHLEGSPGFLDGLLGPADPLRHGGFGNQERPGDLRGGEAPHRAQGERDDRGRRQRGVATHEQEVEGVVALGRRRVVEGQGDLFVRRHQADHQLLPVTARRLGADVVGDASRGHPDQPRARALRRAVERPLRRGGDEGFLDRILRSGEVSVAADDDTQHLRRQIAQQVLDVDRRMVRRRGHRAGLPGKGGQGRSNSERFIGDVHRDVHPDGQSDQGRSFGGALMTSRTSIAMFRGAPPFPGAAEASAAIW